MPDKLGLYIHIPFCKSKCDYCDFYSLPDRGEWTGRYRKALCVHLAETAPMARGYEVDTVYLGGGTPLLLGEKELLALLAFVRKKYRLTRDVEITVEANPDSVTAKSLRALRRAGVNRLSLGMQSAVDEELAAVHRPHTAAQTAQAVEMARRAGFQNLSLDLIYGLPGQTLASWQQSLEAAIALKPEHLSCYGLKVEPGTALAQRVERGETLPDDDAQADCYLAAVSALARAGYEQYEISNFARPGYHSRHNLKYWTLQPYLGFGPAAHSDFGGRRYAFLRDLAGYVTAVEDGGELLVENEVLSQRERGSEYLMLWLRTSHGIAEWEYRREYFMNFDPLESILTEFEEHGWVQRQDRRWRLTPEGFLRSNQLIGRLLEAQEAAAPPRSAVRRSPFRQGGRRR